MTTDTDRELQELSARLDAELGTTEVPPARRERAMFVEGAAQRPGSRIRVLVPALATTALLVAVFFLGRAAQPDDTFYPVHRVLSAVGLADSTVEDVDRLIDSAQDSLDRAELLTDLDERAAIELASDATFDLGRAQALLPGMSGDERAPRAALIDRLQQRAIVVMLAARGVEDNSGPGSGDDSDDSSGPGSGDDSDDSSGPGSGDDSGDSSGPGSGDDSGDSSGPGSDSSGSSGSGSGDALEVDSSGSGSGDELEGDSSGPG